MLFVQIFVLCIHFTKYQLFVLNLIKLNKNDFENKITLSSWNFICEPKPGDKHATLDGKFSKYVEDSFEILTKAIFIILVGTAWFSKAQS